MKKKKKIEVSINGKKSKIITITMSIISWSVSHFVAKRWLKKKSNLRLKKVKIK